MAAATAADGDSTRICSGTLSSTLDLEEAVYIVYGCLLTYGCLLWKKDEQGCLLRFSQPVLLTEKDMMT